MDRSKEWTELKRSIGSILTEISFLTRVKDSCDTCNTSIEKLKFRVITKITYTNTQLNSIRCKKDRLSPVEQ